MSTLLTSLFSYGRDSVCLFDLIKDCERGEKCRNKHIEKTPAIRELIRVIKDPTRILNRDNLNKQISYLKRLILKLQQHPP